ncbi:ABC transporter permease [Salinisphaera hydrothermalis]|uniref:ABC transporter permease n=1 Tax=Salinisphaera hydrothermalis TaxID=563188 RepID=UPI003342A78E
MAESAETRRRRAEKRAGARRIGLGLLGLAIFIGIWKAAYVFNWAPRGTLPDPFEIPAALVREWRSGHLLPAIGSSLIHYVWGLGAGTAAGFLVGLLAASSRAFDDLHYMLARVLRPIPPLAWVVFAIAWFHVSHAGAAFVISIGVFWVNYFATAAGVANVDPRYYELARAFGHGGFVSRVLTITLPGAAPGILSGMRTGVGQAWMTLIAAELLGVPGMGQQMNSAAGVGAYDAVVVYMLAISLIYSISDGLFALVEKQVLRWRP